MSNWFQGLSRYQLTLLLVAWLGWVFDVADTAIFNLAKIPMLTEMLGSEGYKLHGPQIEGQIQTLFLLGWSVGGLIFGVLADKWGRVRTLSVTVGLYCVLTGLTALCHTWQEVACVRFLTAIGIGGEWAAGAALVAEAFRDRSRAPAAGFLQTAAAIGPVLAAIANQALAGNSWRWLFVVGILPAAIAIYARLAVKEPERVTEAASAPLKELFENSLTRRNAFVALAMGFAGIAGAGTVSFWLPNLVKAASPGLEAAALAVRQSEATYSLHAGTLLGVLLFPLICERIGRKPSFTIFFLIAPFSIAVAAVAGSGGDFTRLLLFAPVLSFFSIGVSAGFALYFPELFPSRVRGTGAGFAYNTGRILSAPVPKLTGQLISAMAGNVSGGVIASGLVFLVGLAALPFAPETKGRALPD